MAHLFNDMLQSIISASYPLLKEDLKISFSQIGLITMVYQISSSVFQPVVGLIFDRWPFSKSIPLANSFTLIGLLLLSFSNSIPMILVSVFLVGVGSATIHPEASRITSLASGGKRGFAQSVFQVGGNLGSSLGPLLVAWIVAPYGRHNIVWFAIVSIIAIISSLPICKWYGAFLDKKKEELKEIGIESRKAIFRANVSNPFSRRKTLCIIGILTILIFSKYIYMASLTNYYTFYLIDKFGISVQKSQICLFFFIFATALGTLVGGPVGDKIGRKWVIWISILGTAPFSILMPHMGTTFFANDPQLAFTFTIILTFGAGFVLSSAFPAIIIYSQELLPKYLGLVSGMFYGFAFGVAGIASAILGSSADQYGLGAVYNFCSFTPLFGIVALLLPNINKRRK